MRTLVLLLLVGSMACLKAPKGPQTLYDWGNYDNNLYRLMKAPKDLDTFGASLKAQIDKDPTGHRLAPGIYAEYGYVLFAAGRKPEAAGFFAKEKQRWPESGIMMDKMIGICAPPPPPPAVAPPPEPAPAIPATAEAKPHRPALSHRGTKVPGKPAAQRKAVKPNVEQAPKAPPVEKEKT